MRRLVLLALLVFPAAAKSQLLPGLPAPARAPSPLAQPLLSPGVVHLLELEGQFQAAVARGGGKAFAEYFADDAVILNNGKPAILGRGALAVQTTWSPADYQLTWVAQGAQMGPSNDMGFTWGHYDGRARNPESKDTQTDPILTSGRYITIWRKQPDGSWKVAMDASANDAPGASDCCSLPPATTLPNP